MKIFIIFGIIGLIWFSKFFYQKYLLKYFDSDSMGDFLIQSKLQFREAIPKYKEGIKKNPNKDESYFRLAVCYEMLGDQKKAKELFQKSYALNPYSIDTNTALSLIYADMGDFNRALQHIEAVEKLGKDQGIYDDIKDIIFESFGWINFKRKRFSEAIQFYEVAIPLLKKNWIELKDEFDSLYIHVHFHLGIIYSFKKDWNAAKDEFKKTIISGGEQCIYSKKSQNEIEKIDKIQKN